MSELITVAGLVATTPRHLVTQDGLPITSFRLAASHRKFDRALNTVTAFRQLAINAAGSVSKGERLLVTGKLRVRDWDNGDRVGTSVEIEADALGHDLCWGNSVFTRTVLVRESADLPEPSEADSPDSTEEIEEQEAGLALV